MNPLPHFLLPRHMDATLLEKLHSQKHNFLLPNGIGDCCLGRAQFFPYWENPLLSSLGMFTPTPAPSQRYTNTELCLDSEVSDQLWLNEEYHCQILQNGISSDAEGRRLHRNYRGKFDSFFNPVIKAFAVQSTWNNNVILALNAHLYLSVSINKMAGRRKTDLLSPIH